MAYRTWCADWSTGRWPTARRCVSRTLIIQGRGHVESDEAVRERVYALSPEVEQNHDVAHRGAALIIDVTSVQGTTVRGPVKYSAS